MYEIARQRGAVAERIPGTPLFLSEEDALAYASAYLTEHPSLEQCGVRRKGSIGPIKLPNT